MQIHLSDPFEIPVEVKVTSTDPVSNLVNESINVLEEDWLVFFHGSI